MFIIRFSVGILLLNTLLHNGRTNPRYTYRSIDRQRLSNFGAYVEKKFKKYIQRFIFRVDHKCGWATGLEGVN